MELSMRISKAFRECATLHCTRWRALAGSLRRRAASPAKRAALFAMLVPALLASILPVQADEFDRGRRIFLEKADCTFCHGWAGDGAGQGQSPGGAANLRKSQLQRDQLIMVIGCGIPGTAMPHFDQDAYTDTRCYGQTEADLGARTPSYPPTTTIAPREIEAVADYLLAKVIGRGPITREECREVFGERGRSCETYPPKQ
jgi:mono/diheme cytochrome c family protein